MFPVVLAIDEIQGGVTNKEASITLISNVIEVYHRLNECSNRKCKWCVTKSSILFVQKTGCCTRYEPTEYLVDSLDQIIAAY